MIEYNPETGDMRERKQEVKGKPKAEAKKGQNTSNELVVVDQLAVIVKESGLEQTKAQVLLDKFTGYFQIASDWEKKAKAITVTDAGQKAEKDRLAKEEADRKEQERIREENERLKKEAIAKEEKLQKEREKAEAKQKELEEKADKEKKEIEKNAKKEMADYVRKAKEKEADLERKAIQTEKEREAKRETEKKEREKIQAKLKEQVECPMCHHKFIPKRSK